MPQPAAASCYLLSVTPQPLADMSNNCRCLNYDLYKYFHVTPWSVLINKFLIHIRYNSGLLIINYQI